MSRMFYNATSFNQNISDWNVSNVTNFAEFKIGSSLTEVNTPNF